MIKEFIPVFDAKRDEIKAKIKATDGPTYDDLFRFVCEALAGDYGMPDPERITRIDHGDYQGTLVFVVGAQGYQPYTYWATKVSYGSCSHCDTLQGITDKVVWGEPMSDEVVEEYFTLALHMFQRMVEI